MACVEKDDPDDLPVSCIDIQEQQTGAIDGDYTLYYLGDPDKAWTARCVDMNEVLPLEYLTLPRTGVGVNFSEYMAGGMAVGTTVTTYFDRVRIDPFTLVVDSSDFRFARSLGALGHPDDPGNTMTTVTDVTAMPYGTAMSCDGGPTARANIDLSGTPFYLIETFCEGGVNSIGGAAVSGDGQVAQISGGGSCGWTTLTRGDGSCTDNPVNDNGGRFLNLSFGR